MLSHGAHFAGNLVHKLQFQRIPIGAPSDDHGQLIQQWEDAFSAVWAGLRSPRGVETQMASAEVGYRMTTIELNHRPADDIDVGMRALVVGASPTRILEIVSPAMDVSGLQRFVVVVAREKLNRG